MSKIRILLVDDHALFREGLSRWLEAEPDLEMSAHCAQVGEALEILRQKPIDIVLLDYDLGNERGSEFFTGARKLGFKGRVLVVTAGITGAESIEILRLGASGIFLKHGSPASLARAIRNVMAGETSLDQASMRALLESTKQSEEPSADKPFTEREMHVLRGVLEGLTNKEIGANLDVSESAVKATLQRLFLKTGVRTRSQLVRIALEAGIGPRE
jgi:two-component system, NarL family, nitrate/nitrite response regulator NarL